MIQYSLGAKNKNHPSSTDIGRLGSSLALIHNTAHNNNLQTIHHTIITSNILPSLLLCQRQSYMSSHDQIAKRSSCPLHDLLASSLPVRHFSVALQEYRKWPASKDRHFLKLGSLPRSLERLQSEHVLSLGAQGLRKERREWRSQPLSYCCVTPFQEERPRMVKILFLQLSHKCYSKFLFCSSGFNANCPHHRGSKW